MRFTGVCGEVYVYTFPTQGIPEIVRSNADGSYTILIDETLQRSQQLELVAHALEHARCDADWFQGEDVSAIEGRCHAHQESGRKVLAESQDI
jgi:hypothetical protein